MAVTFRVNLETLSLLGSKGPYSSNDLLGTNFKLTRSTWFPDRLRNNHALKHDDLITVDDEEAKYLDLFTVGAFKFLERDTGISSPPVSLLDTFGDDYFGDDYFSDDYWV